MNMKKVILSLMMVPALMLGFIGCSGNKTANNAPVETVEVEEVEEIVPVASVNQLQGKWTISQVGSDTISIEEMPFMEFDIPNKKLHANVGCNIMNANLVIADENGSSISIDPGQVTMMACPNMEIEQLILQAVPQVQAVQPGATDNEMVLVDENGNALLVLTQ